MRWKTQERWWGRGWGGVGVKYAVGGEVRGVVWEGVAVGVVVWVVWQCCGLLAADGAWWGRGRVVGLVMVVAVVGMRVVL